ncbi:hypothetical protein SAMN05660964_02108 [Thiothrix caldifontis]|jgi:hypothetical protein|uniref:DUF4189 domain-containing protein n=1 Tax=Thiothrix caldifontis TaxID=525918 RepID=A0A1H4D112_9GAMM|nr:hypothetical protein [Thiothrix caldifontis]SEA66261.1 hypothetical protein SAMN05660964_02108 [Thiothrix caldifontis]
MKTLTLLVFISISTAAWATWSPWYSGSTKAEATANALAGCEAHYGESCVIESCYVKNYVWWCAGKKAYSYHAPSAPAY